MSKFAKVLVVMVILILMAFFIRGFWLQKNTSYLPKDKCPCWDNSNNQCLPQSACE